MYASLARFYDRLITGYPYEKLVGFLNKTVGICGKSVLDLCCGTGNASVRMAELGAKSVTALDLSPDMLKVAMAKPCKGTKPTYILGDINALKLDGKSFDIVTAFCDGINYLEPSKIDGFARDLARNGVFFGDFSTEYKLKSVLCGQVFYEDYDDLTYFFRTEVKGNRAKMHLTFFEKMRDNKENYVRYDDISAQFIHKTADVEKAFANAGFEVTMLDAGTLKNVTDTTQRALIIANSNTSTAKRGENG